MKWNSKTYSLFIVHGNIYDVFPVKKDDVVNYVSLKSFISERLFPENNRCMMFFDIRNFTSFSENKDPVEVVNYLNCLFDFIIDIINKNNGIVNKFLGDGFMAVFGAPISGEDDVKNAIQSSFEILERIQLETIKGNIPSTKVGIGLHAGKAVTGNVGSASRKEYTIIGDVVNLASRIEQLNKKYATQILVSEDVWNLYDEKRGEFIDEVDIRGREEKVRIYKLC